VARVTRMTRKRLGQLLIDEGLLDEKHLQEALAEQKKSGGILGETLVRLGYVTEEDIARAVVRQAGCPYISPQQYYITREAVVLFPADVARKHQFVPLDKFGSVVAIVIGGPVTQEVIAELEKISGCSVQFYVGTQSAVREALEATYSATGVAAKAGAKPAPAKAAVRPAPAKPAAKAGARPAAKAGAKPAAPAKGKDAKVGGNKLSSLGSILLGD